MSLQFEESTRAWKVFELTQALLMTLRAEGEQIWMRGDGSSRRVDVGVT